MCDGVFVFAKQIQKKLKSESTWRRKKHEAGSFRVVVCSVWECICVRLCTLLIAAPAACFAKFENFYESRFSGSFVYYFFRW